MMYFFTLAMLIGDCSIRVYRFCFIVGPGLTVQEMVNYWIPRHDTGDG